VYYSSVSPLLFEPEPFPTSKGNKALYTIKTYGPGSRDTTVETRVLDQQTGTSSPFSNSDCDKEAKWLGNGDRVIWLKEVASGETEIWIADSEGAICKYVDLYMMGEHSEANLRPRNDQIEETD